MPVVDPGEDNWSLMDMPEATLNALRDHLTLPLGLKLRAPSRVALNLYDNDMEVLQNFNDFDVDIELDLFGRDPKARALALVLSKDKQVSLRREGRLLLRQVPADHRRALLTPHPKRQKAPSSPEGAFSRPQRQPGLPLPLEIHTPLSAPVLTASEAFPSSATPATPLLPRQTAKGTFLRPLPGAIPRLFLPWEHSRRLLFPSNRLRGPRLSHPHNKRRPVLGRLFSGLVCQPRSFPGSEPFQGAGQAGQCFLLAQQHGRLHGAARGDGLAG